MHTGIAQIPICIQGSFFWQSPYAYQNQGDSLYAYCTNNATPVMFLDVRTQKDLAQHITQGKIADMSESGPRMLTVTPHMHTGRKAKNSHMRTPHTHNKIVRIWE